MAILWTDDLATGVKEIDDQHKELFSRISLLFDACNQGKGRLEIGKTIAFLEDYVRVHFSTEEQYMIRHHYPNFEAHAAQHRDFTANLIKIKQQLEEQGPGVHIIILTNHMIIHWLRDHIRKLDRALGDYLQNWT